VINDAWYLSSYVTTNNPTIACTTTEYLYSAPLHISLPVNTFVGAGYAWTGSMVIYPG